MTRQEAAALVTDRRDLRCPFAPDVELAAIRDTVDDLPTVHLAFGPGAEFDALAITRYADVRQVLADERFRTGFAFDPDQPRTLANQPGFLLNYNGPEHARLRRMLTGAFTVRRVQLLRPQVEEIVTAQLDELAKAGPGADLVTDFAFPVPSQVICALLGVPYAERAEFQQRTESILEGRGSTERAVDAVTEFRAYVAGIVGARRADPDDSLLGNLIRERGDELTDDELIGISILLLIAGHETTSNMIALSTLALLRHPEQHALVRDDDGVTGSAVEELLRQLSIASPLVRKATEDVAVGDHRVRAGQYVVVSALAANWDPQLVGDAPELDVRRKPLPHLAFGHGRHQCLGQQLARLELRIAIPALLRRFPGLRLAVPEADLRFRVNSSVYALRALPISW
ncbi:cytochrome P450 [Streptomyces sp. NPDC057137]|uniref:cytochrome P450 n=1 Tax=Streptomyces sp. NPDC057137 TaxID=3346030 RepID=UPI00363F9BF8